MRAVTGISVFLTVVLAGCTVPSTTGTDLAGCTQNDVNSNGTNEMTAATQITSIRFNTTPAVNQPVTLRFNVTAMRDISDARLTVNVSNAVAITGETDWRQNLSKDGTYTFTRRLTFTEAGEHRVNVLAGMYRNRNGTVSVSRDVDPCYINIKQDTVVIRTHPPVDESTTGRSHQEETAPTDHPYSNSS